MIMQMYYFLFTNDEYKWYSTNKINLLFCSVNQNIMKVDSFVILFKINHTLILIYKIVKKIVS